ncbi:MAG: hypothetical protein ACHQ50_08210 [Fimbriimonadales bacterium]
MAVVSIAQLSADKDIVLAGDTAYGMLQPLPVVANAGGLEWSSDGRFLLVLTMDPGAGNAFEGIVTPQAPDAAEMSIVLYSVQGRKASLLWHSTRANAEIGDLKWIEDSDCAVATVTEKLRTVDPNDPSPTRQDLIWIDARAATIRTIFSVNQSRGWPNLAFEASPSRPFGLLMLQSPPGGTISPNGRITATAAQGTTSAANPQSGPFGWQVEYRTVDAAGAIGRPIAVQSGFFRGWTRDGGSLRVEQPRRMPDGQLLGTDSVLDLSTGKLAPPTAAQNAPVPRIKVPVSVILGNSTLTRQQSKRDVKTAWLVSDSGDSQAMIAGDALGAELSPTLDAVAYVSQGVALIRPIVKMPKEGYLQGMRAVEKAKIMNQAKQAVLGLIMYSADNDDKFPSSQEDVSKLLGPYVRNNSLLSGFVYTFGGGLATDIKEPANTIVGYILGPGGRANAYADGHVQWQYDQ